MSYREVKKHAQAGKRKSWNLNPGTLHSADYQKQNFEKTVPYLYEVDQEKESKKYIILKGLKETDQFRLKTNK